VWGAFTATHASLVNSKIVDELKPYQGFSGTASYLCTPPWCEIVLCRHLGPAAESPARPVGEEAHPGWRKGSNLVSAGQYYKQLRVQDVDLLKEDYKSAYFTAFSSPSSPSTFSSPSISTSSPGTTSSGFSTLGKKNSHLAASPRSYCSVWESKMKGNQQWSDRTTLSSHWNVHFQMD